MPRPVFTKDIQYRLQRHFDDIIIARGRGYYLDNRVKIKSVQDYSVNAEVNGTEVYKVVLDWRHLSEHDLLQSYCGCPYFSDGNLCKHLWALILQMDHDGISGRVEIEGKVKMSLLSSAGAPADEVEDNFYDEVGDWRSVLTNQANPTTQAVFSHTVPPTFINPLVLASEGVVMEFVPQDHLGGQEKLRLYFYFKSTKRVLTQKQGPSHLDFDASSALPFLPEMSKTTPLFLTAEDFSEFKSKKSDKRIQWASSMRMSWALKDKPDGSGWNLDGVVELKIKLKSKAIKKQLSEAEYISSSGFCAFGNYAGYLEADGKLEEISRALKGGPISVPQAEAQEFLELILNSNSSIQLPPSLKWKEGQTQTEVKVVLTAEKSIWGEIQKYLVELKFKYGSRWVSFGEKQQYVVSSLDKVFYKRNLAEELRQWNLLPHDLMIGSGLRLNGDSTILAKHLFDFVSAVVAQGLPVDVEGKPLQTAKGFQFSVSTGLDWFDVQGQAQFTTASVNVPTLLEAVKKGLSFIPLEDGSVGLLNEEIKRKLQKFSDFSDGQSSGQEPKLRFARSQGFLLNSILDEESDLKLDQKFKELREKIKNFTGVKPLAAPQAFKGKLRKYQKDGLGWLKFLDDYGLGGILADDMGLGKTIQCLAFLEHRRAEKKSNPSLLLAPKTLLTNWQAEALKFTPKLKLMILSGSQRESKAEIFSKYDLVVTTYQTMLRDLEALKSVEWDCLILDEAQSIKNANAQVSRAAKALNARFKLAMTGTPIENSIQDLFSISDFVNPGFLKGKGRSEHLKLGDESKKIIVRAFKPLILRRTKDQVLKDLPAKTEQVISVELEDKQLKAYNELKNYYQAQLLSLVQQKGVKKSQIQILAALTRLRQAALHVGLIDPGMHQEKSAKFDVLLGMLDEVLGEGHKVLIFSQFTGLLSLLRGELNKKSIAYSYLDGKTKNRKEVVESFKSKEISVFLMSLKAGGVGLNLVEADYVFLLDPWWNPAAETQAIDRAHRIGQTRPVNAYRLIAKGTVEEKILELQKSKKNLSSEILDSQSGLLRNLTAQDIAQLLA